MSTLGFGIDIGGSGIKGAPVDLKQGRFATDRHRIPTPQPSVPDAVVAVIAQIVEHFSPEPGTPLGITFPGVVQHGVIHTASNMDDSWIGVDLEALCAAATGYPVSVLNDADAAGYAEFRFGAARGRDGVTLLTTLGTGIGTALIVDGTLVPNTEFGHVTIDGDIAEEHAAESSRERHQLTDVQWIAHLQRFYDEMEKLLWPDLIIVGGGVSKEHGLFLPHLRLRAPIIPAQLFNDAGIVGAAAYAQQQGKARAKQQAKKAKKVKKAKKSA